jgi:AAA+ superfamily predicted ATPase
MLLDAVKAKIPLISIRCQETAFIEQLLAHVTGEKIYMMGGQEETFKAQLYGRLSREGKGPEDPVKLYRKLLQAGATCIYVNINNPHSVFLDLGELTTPATFVKAKLEQMGVPAEPLKKVMPALGGLTAKVAYDVVSIAASKNGKTINAKEVLNTRRQLVQPTKGVSTIDTAMQVYKPMPKLQQYVQEEKEFFLNGYDPRLRPRGLMFTGMPGTGKTAGAKYIAAQWGVPLFRIDATVQSKWVGESESNLQAALGVVDAAQPCVVLLDEIEKLFSGSATDNTGIMRRMMGSLLWWLQEHTSRVFMVMTSNDHKSLPPELYRDGRIDGMVEFMGIDLDEAMELGKMIVKSYVGDAEVPASVMEGLKALLEKTIDMNDGKPIAHVNVETKVKQIMKQAYAKGEL